MAQSAGVRAVRRGAVQELLGNATCTIGMNKARHHNEFIVNVKKQSQLHLVTPVHPHWQRGLTAAARKQVLTM